MEPVRAESLLEFLEATQTVIDIPQRLRVLLRADECVIWKPSKRLKKGLPLAEPYSQCRLYPLTSTFVYQQGVQHSGLPLDFENDATGRMYKRFWDRNFEPLPPNERIENDFRATDVNGVSVKFMRRLNLLRMCTSMFFFDDNEAPYAVSLYRRELASEDQEGTPSDLFQPEEVESLDRYTRLIPFLMRRHLDGHFRAITRKVYAALSPANTREEDRIDQTLEELCTTLAASFHCKEVTIVLQNHNSETFAIRASSLPIEKIQKKAFSANKLDGLTGYTLATGKTLEFHDLRNFRDPEMIPIIQHNWGTDIDWKDSADILRYYRKLNPEISEEVLPPVAFLAVPIPNSDPSVSPTQPIGLIRCSLGTNPYYFTSGEKDMLALIAASLGHWWSDVLNVRAEKDRADLFKGSLDVHEKLQVSIWKAIHAQQIRDVEVIGSVVQALFKTFQGVKLVCFRRQGEGAAGRELTISEIAHARLGMAGAKKGLRTPLSELPLAASVLGDEMGLKWYSAEEVRASRSAKEKQLYQEFHEILCVRVGFEGYTAGVLDFGFSEGKADEEYKQHFQRVALDIARQLAVFEQIRNIQEMMKKSLEDQILMTQSVGHQIKSPLANALDVLRQFHRTLNDARRSSGAYLTLGRRLTEIVPQRVPLLLGMIGKALAVGRFMESFGKLSRNERVVPDTEHWSMEALLRLSKEIARNNQVSEESQDDLEEGETEGPARRFVWQGEFEGTPDDTADSPAETLRYSRHATEQILDAVLGNALKYSEAGKDIEVSGQYLPGYFEMTVTNTADDEVVLTEEDAKHCFEKGWRGESTSGRIGSGLGLWIAHMLMTQQDGEIEAKATTNGNTTFLLRFPLVD